MNKKTASKRLSVYYLINYLTTTVSGCFGVHQGAVGVKVASMVEDGGAMFVQKAASVVEVLEHPGRGVVVVGAVEKTVFVSGDVFQSFVACGSLKETQGQFDEEAIDALDVVVCSFLIEQFVAGSFLIGECFEVVTSTETYPQASALEPAQKFHLM